MDLKTIKLQHPSLYAEVFELGVASGRAKEHERIRAHFIMGEAAGPEGLQLAIRNVQNNVGFGDTVGAQYSALALQHNAHRHSLRYVRGLRIDPDRDDQTDLSRDDETRAGSDDRLTKEVVDRMHGARGDE